MIRFVIFVLLLTSAPLAFGADREWDEIEKILQRKGTRRGDILELAYPRYDLSVRVDRTILNSAMGLTSRIVFKKTGTSALIAGELPLLPKEVPVVLRKLKAENLKVTAQYIRIKGSRPQIAGVHFAGRGDAASLVWAFTPAFSATGTPMGPPLKKTGHPVLPHSWQPVEEALGIQGEQDGSILRFNFKRLPDGHGECAASELLFQMVGRKKAAVTGTLTLVRDEVGPVRKALTMRGVTVTAEREDILSRSPQLVLLHFWGLGEPSRLADALKRALILTRLNRIR